MPKGCKVMMSPFENMFPDSKTIRAADMRLHSSRPIRFLRIVVPKGFSGPLILREVSVEDR